MQQTLEPKRVAVTMVASPKKDRIPSTCLVQIGGTADLEVLTDFLQSPTKSLFSADQAEVEMFRVFFDPKVLNEKGFIKAFAIVGD